MPRLFTAIEIDSEARQRIAAQQQRLQDDLREASLRWVRPEHLHLTLTFIGEVTDDLAAAIVKVMHRDIPRRPFQIELAGFGVFPSRGAPRALWLGVQRGADEVVALQQILAGRLHELGTPLEPRPFSPHLTLARWRGRGGRASERPRHLGVSHERVAIVDVGAAGLVQSRLSSDGPAYTVLAESRLTGLDPSLH